MIVLGGARSAAAATITFDSLGPGINGDNFITAVEFGFTVYDESGGWVEGHFFGNPVPSIFTSGPDGRVTVTNGGTFTFSSVDLGNASGGSTSLTYTIQGFLLGAPVFSTSATIGSPNAFTTISSPDSSSFIDLLRITIDGTNTSSYNIDNIVVDASTVPEPATLLMLGAGLAGLRARRHRSHRQRAKH